MEADESRGAQAGLSQAGGSAPSLEKEYRRGYSHGYNTSVRRVRALEEELRRLRGTPTAPDVNGTDQHDSTITYLLTTAEALTKAAECLISARLRPEPVSEPNGKADR